MTTPTIEFTELQAVDFALGAFLATVFTPLAPVGPKEWQEFLARPLKEKIYRGSYENPADFIKALQASGVKDVKLPLVYYFRKPGFTNADNGKSVKGKARQNDDKFFNITALPISLDYRLYLLAWDTPALDKLGLAWYRHINSICSTFPVNYKVDTETFDVNCYVDDNRTVTLSDSSSLYVEGKRLYGIMTALTVKTQVLIGAVSPVPPDFVTVEVELKTPRSERYVVAIGDGVTETFIFDSLAWFGRTRPFNEMSVKFFANRVPAGEDTGLPAITKIFTLGATEHTLTATVFNPIGRSEINVVPPLPAGTELAIKYDNGPGIVGAFTHE